MRENEHAKTLNDAKMNIRERIIQDGAGTGSGTKWNVIATSAMAGNEEARKEIERLLGRPIENMTDLWNVLSVAYDLMSFGERQLSDATAHQILRAQSDPARMADDYLGNKLGSIRRERGMTQAELAKKSGVALTMLQKYESGGRKLIAARADTVLKLARALGATVEELMSEDGT